MAADMTITDKLAEALRALITQWRHNAQGCTRRESHAADTWRSCARELDAAFAKYDANPGGWLPMDSAPKDGRRILCVAGGRVPYIGYHHIDDGWLDDSGSFRNPRFWQPLPPPPKEPQS